MSIKILSALVMASLPLTSFASSCSFDSLSDEAFGSAKHVFVFRILGTEIRESPSAARGYELGHGRLRVVENLRGNAPYESFAFNAHGTCGAKLVPGHYYLGVSFDADRFVAGPASVLDLTGSYREGVNNSQAFLGFSWLAAAASGAIPLSTAHPVEERLPIAYLPPPPPPPHCGTEVP